jgi:rare lipoprotein A
VTIAGRSTIVSLSLFSLVVAGCGSGSPRFAGREEASAATSQLEGIASYYAEEFDGRKTANGETYDMNSLTAAHRTLPFNSRVRVTNRENGKSVVVRINDRGPFKGDRVIDLSLAAAKVLGMIPHGTALVTIDVIEAGSQ